MKIIKQDILVRSYTNRDWHISWLKTGELHREDGPTIICNDCSYNRFWLKGKFYRDIKEYWKEVHANY